VSNYDEIVSKNLKRNRDMDIKQVLHKFSSKLDDLQMKFTVKTK